jgi:hypothetical protein
MKKQPDITRRRLESGGTPIACPVCGGGDMLEFFSLKCVPTQDGAMWPTRNEALHAPVGDIALMYCRSCQYIWNRAHDAGHITFDRYDFSMQSSPAFQQFVQRLSRRLVSTYHLRGKTIVDIGCGDGHFLGTLCRMGGNTGLGIDPGHTPQRDGASDVRYVKEYYSDRHAVEPRDFVSCRHVLNAISDPVGFTSLIRRTMNGNTPSTLYVEVPNAACNFDGTLVWNVAYEHRSWFTAASIRALLSRSGFRVTGVRPCWGGEYLSVEAVPSAGDEGGGKMHMRPDRKFERTLAAFAGTYARKVRSVQKKLDSLSRGGIRTAIWGAGARALTLLSVCDLHASALRIVDINPRRQRMHLPRSGYRVWTPGSLREFRPDLVIISNPRFAREIRDQARALGVGGRFLVL